MKKLLSLLAFLSITALNARDFTPEEMEILSKAYAKKPEKVKEHTAECYGVEGSLDPKSIECRGRRFFLQQS